LRIRYIIMLGVQELMCSGWFGVLLGSMRLPRGVTLLISLYSTNLYALLKGFVLVDDV